MKKLRAIALALIVLLLSAFCLTACDKKTESAISSGDQIIGHYGEVAQIVLTAKGVESSSQEYSTEKDLVQTQIENKVSLLGQTYLDDLVLEVVGSSGVKNSYLTKYLKCVDNYLIKNIEVQKALNSLATKYPTITELKELAKDFDYEFNLQEDLISQVVGYALGAPIIALTEVISINGVIEQLVYNKSAITSEDYNYTIQALEQLYSAGKTLVNASDISLLVNIAINFALSDKSYTGVYNLLPLEYQQSLDQVISTLKTDFNLTDANKKQAYIDFVTIILENDFNMQVDSTYASDISQMISLAESYIVMGDEYFELVAKSLNEQGDILSSGVINSKQREKLINATKILDRNGIGYFTDKYLPLYTSSQAFIGQILKQISSQDLQSLLYLGAFYSQIDEFGLTEIQKEQFTEQIQVISQIILANAITSGYNETNKTEFTNAFVKAFGSDSLLNLSVYHIGEIAKRYSQNTLLQVISLLQGELPLSQAVIDSVNSSFAFLLLIWGTADYAQEGIGEAKQEVLRYLSPIYTLAYNLGLGGYIEMGKETASQVKSMNDLILLIKSYLQK